MLRPFARGFKSKKVVTQNQFSGHRREIAKLKLTTVAWFAQLGERRFAEREVAGSNPGRTNTHGL